MLNMLQKYNCPHTHVHIHYTVCSFNTLFHISWRELLPIDFYTFLNVCTTLYVVFVSHQFEQLYIIKYCFNCMYNLRSGPTSFFFWLDQFRSDVDFGRMCFWSDMFSVRSVSVGCGLWLDRVSVGSTFGRI